MKKLLKRVVNVLSMVGTLLGLFLLLSPSYPYRLECLLGMAFGYGIIIAINYILFSKPTIWNSQVDA